MQEAKSFIIAAFSSILAFIQPIVDNIFAMIILLGVNFMFGLLAGVLSEGEKFSWQKAWQAMNEALLLFGVVVCVYIIGKLNGNMPGAIWCVSTIVYAMCYFYAVRILRNMCKLLHENSPAYSVVHFLYSALTMELAKKIPGLEQYIKIKKDGETNS